MSLNPINERIAGRIRDRRKKAGLTEEELGRAVDLSSQQISKIELSERRVKREEYGRFAAALGMTVEELFGELGSPMEPTRTSGTGIAGAKGSGGAEVVRGDQPAD